MCTCRLLVFCVSDHPFFSNALKLDLFLLLFVLNLFMIDNLRKIQIDVRGYIYKIPNNLILFFNIITSNVYLYAVQI